MRSFTCSVLLLAATVTAARADSSDLDEMRSQLAALMQLDAGQALLLVAAHGSPEGSQLIVGILPGDNGAAARLFLLLQAGTTESPEYLEVDLRPELPGVQTLGLRDAGGRAIARPTRLEVARRSGNSLVLRVTCDGRASPEVVRVDVPDIAR